MENFQILPIKKLYESPLNPRHTFNEKKMEELVESIRTKGILMALLVRPNNGRFEIAAGHRRYRAAIKVGLDEAPVIVREMSDVDFIEILTIENLQREDLEPLDEAQGYQTLLEKTGNDVPSIAAKVGKSESYIYQRLKLLELIPEAQKKLAEGKMTAGHAILIARLQPKQQKEALKAMFEWRDEGKSVRELNDWINRNIHLDLHSASFPKDDKDLVPEAGPCTTCPKRTGFTPLLFPDIQKKDTCTDPVCFRAKVQAFSERWIKEKSEDTDQPPLCLSEQWDGRVKKLPDDPKRPVHRGLYHEIEGKKDRCESVREGIVVDGRTQGQVKQVCVDPKCEKHHGRRSYSPETAKWRAQQKAQEEKRKSKKAIRLRILDETLKKISDQPVSREDLAFVVEQFFDELWDEYRKSILSRHELKAIKGQYTSDQHTPMKKYVESANKGALWKLLMEMALIRNIEPSYHYGQKKEDVLMGVAERYKVNVKAIEKDFAQELKEKKEKKKGKSKKNPPKARTIPMKDLCKLHAKPGVCRVCGCTDDTPCEGPDGVLCHWADRTKTLCSVCRDKGVKEEVDALEKEERSKKKVQTSAKAKAKAK